jgi:hypothetical protein
MAHDSLSFKCRPWVLGYEAVLDLVNAFLSGGTRCKQLSEVGACGGCLKVHLKLKGKLHSCLAAINLPQLLK